ncbi:hypothetical protein [Nonomuraea indica]|uniref:hypothetical protein n=1 Tax=Nonomuraea indica TaxID=1581193 RepID=UPI000C7AB19A|nr:hypothetical protein [Nonomuraea indica]
MASGLYISTLQDTLDVTQSGFNWELETHRWALYNSSKTPNYNDDITYSTVNEIAGTGYVAGGELVTGTTFSKSGGTLTYDSDPVQWTSSTLTGVRHVDQYAAAIAGDPLMIGFDLGTSYNTSDGTLLLTPNVSGLLAFDGTP